MWIDLPPFIYRMNRTEALVALPAMLFGPAIVAALATSWLTGRQGRGAGVGSLIGMAAAGVAAGLSCCAAPLVYLAPLVGAIVASVAVLRTG